MLWLPGKHTLKRIARIQRRTIARLLLFVFLLFGLGTAAVPPQESLLVDVAAVTAGHNFDFVDWESQALLSEVQRRWSPPAVPDSPKAQQALVLTFLKQAEHLAGLQGELNKSYTTHTRTTLSPQNSTLAEAVGQLRAAQNDIRPQVEFILARQVETILHDEGFTVAGTVFPPVAFRFVEPPTALILSPRDHIQNQYFIGLEPGLDYSQRNEIESALDRRGDVSSYVTDIGGLGSYPTMVINNASIPYLIDTIAHEWTHNYFFTFPTNLAWAYQSDPKLMIINETAASLVGGEISRKVIARFYPDWLDQLPPVDRAGLAVPPKPSEFALAMRRIRQEVDDLLATGQIEAAEILMEAERLQLVEKGYSLRKLNQAYFAFHGSYALSPGSIDPTGAQLRRLRAASPSLKAFLDQAGWLNSYADYTAWLAKTGIN